MRWPWDEVEERVMEILGQIPPDNLEPESLRGDGRSGWGGWGRSQDVPRSPDHLGGILVTAPTVLPGIQQGNTRS